MDSEKYFAPLKPTWQRMCALLKRANINITSGNFFYGYSFRFDTMTNHFYVSVKTQALSCLIFGQEITSQYLKRTIMRNKVISEVDVPFDVAQQFIEKKWGYLLEQEQE